MIHVSFAGVERRRGQFRNIKNNIDAEISEGCNIDVFDSATPEIPIGLDGGVVRTGSALGGGGLNAIAVEGGPGSG